MSELLKKIEKRLIGKGFKEDQKEDFNNEMKEILQCIVLSELSKTDFFLNNVFQGGTALRLLYNLQRYSQDLDFILKDKENFNWEKYFKLINENIKKQGLEFTCKNENMEDGYRLIIIDDSVLKTMHGKNIVPDEWTIKNNRKKTKIKLETCFGVTDFISEKKTMYFPEEYKIEVLDIHSLFVGKINACLTREKTDDVTKEKIKTDTGRDWYDLVWYIDNRIKPNYKYLSSKLNYKGMFAGKGIEFNGDILKVHLLSRMEGLDYEKLNSELFSITKSKNRIILNEKLLKEKISQIGAH